MKVFGCTAYMHIPDEKRSKLDKKSRRCIFIGYPEHSKGYKLYDPGSGKMVRSRNVIFVEDDFKDNNVSRERQPKDLLKDVEFVDNETNDMVVRFETDDIEVNDLPRDEVMEEDMNDMVNDMLGDNVLVDDNVNRRTSQREKSSPDRYGDWEYASIANVHEPRNIREAFEGIHAKEWKSATDDEYNSLMENQTWELVDLPRGKNLIGSKWVFKVKHGSDGEVDRFKARLVAQGYTQEPGIDYKEVFAPVARYNSIRSILAIANQLDLEVHQMDVKSAFLNGNLAEEIYMKQPNGYIDKNNPHMVCKLQKSLYGLKQSARCWNLVLDSFLKSNGYVQSSADPCIYCKVMLKNGKRILMIIAIYVDDTILASNDINMLKEEKLKLSKRFEMDDRGEIHYLLGMCIRRDRKLKTLTIDQSIYLQNVLKRFGFDDCKSVSTPMEAGKKFQKLSDDDVVDIKKYQAAIGSLVYASIGTRPDISVAVGALSQFMSKPGQEHWSGVKRIFRYLKGTLSYGLKFVASDNFVLHGYCDADWAGDTDTRKSTSGYIFKLGGATISWSSKRQAVVALSSTEAEYIALSYAAQEIVWLRNLLSSLGFRQAKPTVLFEDN